MKIIKNNCINEIIIKNSRFICLLFKIDDSNIDKILEDVKKNYPKATHYCYGYILDQVKHFSDDGEPGGTAGMPILNVLEKEELNKILCVVVRYFGGIKLGAGGLVRAYTKSVTETLKASEFLELENGYEVEITFDYTLEKQIKYLLKDATIISEEYNEKITYRFLANDDLLLQLYNYDIKVINNTYIEKKI